MRKPLLDANNVPALPNALFRNNRLDAKSLADVTDKDSAKEIYGALLKASLSQPFLGVPDRKGVGKNVRPNEEQAKLIVDTYIRFLEAYACYAGGTKVSLVPWCPPDCLVGQSWADLPCEGTGPSPA